MTLAIAAIVAVAIAVLAGLLLPPWLRGRRRRRLLQQPDLPPVLRRAIRRDVPATAQLPAPLAYRLDGLVSAFLVEKEFVGCNGQGVTDEMRATIAAQACLLLLGRPGSLYDELQSILVYPGTFFVEDEVHDDDGLVTQRRRELSGEAWDSHRIILSWQDIAETAERPADGYNVVLHEFAHYLDAEGRGPADASRDPARWREALQEEHDALVAAVERDEATFLDPYAAEDAAEFFAVASETFVECPVEFELAEPRLYALMVAFYGIDPAGWASPSFPRPS